MQEISGVQKSPLGLNNPVNVIEADSRNADIAGNAVPALVDPDNETVLTMLLYFCSNNNALALLHDTKLQHYLSK